MSRLPLIAAGLVICCGIVLGDFVGYDPTSRNEMPGTGWTLDPTYQAGVNPIRREVPAGSGTVVSDDGIAHLDCNNSGTTGGTSRWYYSGIGFDTSVGLTLDFKVHDLVNATDRTGCSFRLLVDDKFGVIISVFSNVGGDSDLSRLQLIWSDGPTEYTDSVADRIDLDYFHTFRLAVLDTDYAIYVDDQADPILTGTVPLADRNENTVYFGDLGSVSNGSSDLKYVLWDSSQAIFSAPIPEPATMVIAIGGGVSLIWTRKRRGA